ncbi:MAG: DUF1848 family protein [Anaerolineae bacterium]|nr:DUF1848 family protein [Anaerolineae bacterium]
MRAVISASRRTDLPRCYPEWLAEVIRAGEVDVPLPYGRGSRYVSLRPEDVHTVVLWSKDFGPLLDNRGGVRDALSRYEQCYALFTITGLGGSALEPAVPPWQEAVGQLDALVGFMGDPRRVAVRFDPIVHWVDAGAVCNNLPFADAIFRAAAERGITRIISSFAQMYDKVRRRDWPWHDPPREEKVAIGRHLVELARAHGLSLRACCDPFLLEAGAEPSHCIDAALLTALHPRGLPADARPDKGQRAGCGCTLSVDIGSYRQRCPNGCLYCYANPVAGT